MLMEECHHSKLLCAIKRCWKYVGYELCDAFSKRQLLVAKDRYNVEDDCIPSHERK